MKEIQQFESWATNLLEEASTKGFGDRPIPKQHDLQYQAQTKYPELSPEQALQVYIADKLEQNEKTDQIQDKEINNIEHDEQSIKSQLARLIDLVKRQ